MAITEVDGDVDLPSQIDGVVPEPIVEKIGENERLQPVKGKAAIRRKDAYDVDFSDTRSFAAFRWMDILKATAEKLSSSDREMAAKYYDWELLADEIESKLKDPASTPIAKRQMARIQPFPRALSLLVGSFEKTLLPYEVKFDLLWGLIYLNLRLSYDSPDKLKWASDWLNRVRQVVELFNRCVDVCEELNEMRIAIVDFLDPIVLICLDSISYLHEYSSDAQAAEAWPDLNEEINSQISVLNATVKHLNDITSLSKVNLAAKIKNLSLRHTLTPESDEPGTFPNLILPFRQNQRFYGRNEELERMNRYLSPKDDQSLRTYSIYGRRGVGKTEIAIQFAYTNQAGFDAIFWIQCETLVSIRQSFTNVAVSLNLPGADKDGHHEENLLAVHEWLKKTRKRWLLIFDNAGQDYILQGYWPIGASGAILTTSRKYYNFSKDAQRRGDTVKPFDPKQSWDLLLQLLGDDWKKLDREGRIPQSEIIAAKLMLDKLNGLALAIQQAAILIKNDEIGGPTIVKTYETFEKTIQTLPKRLEGDRAKTEKGLDALWDMTFNSCSRNARVLLGVLAWLSPDIIPEQLFLPRNQKALDGRLQFCKQDPQDIDEYGFAKPISIGTTSPAFDDAIADLRQKELIKQDGRMYSIHRVVQEATNYHDKKDLQESFDSASKLVYEAFPRQVKSGSLYKEWNTCQDYIAHGVYLRKRYSDYARSKQLKPSDAFVRLLTNCGVYLMEISDQDTCGRVVKTALSACEDKSSLLYADLLNLAGRRSHEENRLVDCRKYWVDTLRIRREHLPSDDVLIGAIYHNLGNVETATGNLKEATDYYQQATEIYMKHEAASQLALTDLCVGRLYLLQNKFHEARNMVARSEALFVRELGTDRGFTVHVHYAYGNIEFLQKNWTTALREYEICLRIALSDTPIHPITAASYYSLACVELELGHSDKAKGYLDKARRISELRSPTRDDGPLARILWKTAVVMESDTFGKNASVMAMRTYAAEAAALRHRAEVARQELVASGEGGLIPFIEEDADRDQEEDDYDALVPLYFR